MQLHLVHNAQRCAELQLSLHPNLLIVSLRDVQLDGFLDQIVEVEGGAVRRRAIGEPAQAIDGCARPMSQFDDRVEPLDGLDLLARVQLSLAILVGEMLEARAARAGVVGDGAEWLSHLVGDGPH